MLKICSDSICNHLELISKQGLLAGTFPSEWKKKVILSLFIENVTSKIQKITVHYLCYEFVVKLLKDLFFMKCSVFILLITLSQQTSLASNLVTGTNQLLSTTHKIYIHLLMMDKKFGVFIRHI